MSIGTHLANLSWEDVERLLQKYEALGPVPGLLLPWVEALLPFLPLVAIVIANVNAYGLAEGMLLSWIGVVAGAVTVFGIVRRFGTRLRLYVERKVPRSQKLTGWLEKHGFMPIFLLSCFPFTPSFLVNLVSGMSRVPFHTFLIATLLGKGVMIGIVSLVGQDLGALIREPWRIIGVVAVFVLLGWLGKRIETKFFK